MIVVPPGEGMKELLLFGAAMLAALATFALIMRRTGGECMP